LLTGCVKTALKNRQSSLSTETMSTRLSTASFSDRDASRPALADWAGTAALEIVPAVSRLDDILLGYARLFADETTTPVLDPRRGRTKKGDAWEIARDDRPRDVNAGRRWCSATRHAAAPSTPRRCWPATPPTRLVHGLPNSRIDELMPWCRAANVTNCPATTHRWAPEPRGCRCACATTARPCGRRVGGTLTPLARPPRRVSTFASGQMLRTSTVSVVARCVGTRCRWRLLWFACLYVGGDIVEVASSARAAQGVRRPPDDAMAAFLRGGISGGLRRGPLGAIDSKTTNKASRAALEMDGCE